MGLLDDAIREHLDLKRRRGADPTEIERAEREALGPVRRGPEELGGDAMFDYSSAGVAAYDREGEPDTESGYHDAEPERGEELEHHSQPAAEPEDVNRSGLAADVPGHPSEPEPDDATVEYDVEHALGAESEPEHQREHHDDMLEATPEFLQDTPDHDRLWFEQRPPRDFDFDG